MHYQQIILIDQRLRIFHSGTTKYELTFKKAWSNLTNNNISMSQNQAKPEGLAWC